ncbi:hypothetical protein AL057_27145 [Pseudomonas amygdali pv. myricae]|nr:hypothetical protein AL057_27145 [Pseudomonas amygdali pv. myricae]
MAYHRVVVAWVITAIALLPISVALLPQASPSTTHKAYLALLIIETTSAIYATHRTHQCTLRKRFCWVLWGIVVAFFWTWY